MLISDKTNYYILPKKISLNELISFYEIGLFPMANSRQDKEIYLVEPAMRGIIPICDFKPSKSLKREINKKRFSITLNNEFKKVMEKCANRNETWINRTIVDLYCKLYEKGYAKSVEVWLDDKMVGGLYGVSLKRAFFGESMFSTENNASKIALYYLIEHLKENEYTLLDTQFITPHLKSLGGIEISQSEYLKILKKALK